MCLAVVIRFVVVDVLLSEPYIGHFPMSIVDSRIAWYTACKVALIAIATFRL